MVYMYQTNVWCILSGTHLHAYTHFATATLKFGLSKCPISISRICSHPTGCMSCCLGTTRQDDQIHEPETLKFDACQRPWSQSSTINHPDAKPQSGCSGPWTGPAHYSAEYSADTRNWTPGARVALVTCESEVLSTCLVIFYCSQAIETNLS